MNTWGAGYICNAKGKRKVSTTVGSVLRVETANGTEEGRQSKPSSPTLRQRSPDGTAKIHSNASGSVESSTTGIVKTKKKKIPGRGRGMNAKYIYW